jgi:hypothetical protein
MEHTSQVIELIEVRAGGNVYRCQMPVQKGQPCRLNVPPGPVQISYDGKDETRAIGVGRTIIHMDRRGWGLSIAGFVLAGAVGFPLLIGGFFVKDELAIALIVVGTLTLAGTLTMGIIGAIIGGNVRRQEWLGNPVTRLIPALDLVPMNGGLYGSAGWRF